MNMTNIAVGALLAVAPLILACSSVTDDGSGGTFGVGGNGGVGGAALTCAESSASCENGPIDPIVREDGCLVADPPVLPDACTGTESLELPPSCSQTGNTITYQLTSIELVDDCNLGYDLDGCNGESCIPGDNAPGEGNAGVDNALAGLAPLGMIFGTNLSVVNQNFYDNLCDGDVVVRFVLDANPEEGCMTVQIFRDGEFEGTRLVNLGDSGCISGKLGNIPFDFRDTPFSFDNVVGRMTVSETGLANGIVGGTIDRATTSAIAERWFPELGARAVDNVLDINAELDNDPLLNCNALSVTLRVGGVAEEAPTNP